MSSGLFARPVVHVAPALIGGLVVHGRCAGRIVETEAYHDGEPACHAHIGVTRRTATLFGPPGRAYVYRSYGIHALFNVVTEPEGVGAAVLIRALEPLEGLEVMRARRRQAAPRALCSGPGKLTQALGIELEHNGSDLATGPVRVLLPDPAAPPPVILAGPRVGITKAVELPWRFCLAGSPHVSRPTPPGWPGRLRRTASRTRRQTSPLVAGSS